MQKLRLRRVDKLPKVTQLISVGTGKQIQPCLNSELFSLAHDASHPTMGSDMFPTSRLHTLPHLRPQTCITEDTLMVGATESTRVLSSSHRDHEGGWGSLERGPLERTGLL